MQVSRATQSFESGSRVTSPSPREQVEDVLLIVSVQADAAIFQEGKQVLHGLLSFVGAPELHHGTFQSFDADMGHIRGRLEVHSLVDQPVIISSDMTWDELKDLLSVLAQENDTELKVIPIEGLEAVFLHLVPVAWFSSMKMVPALNMGVYEGEERRIVGTEQIPLAELTPEFVRERVQQAAAQQFSLSLDPQAVRDFLEQFPKPRMRDVKDAG